MKFHKIKIEDLQINPISMFSGDWPLLTAGDDTHGFNTMTIAWGHIGAIWNGLGIPSINVYVRPQRFTKKFMEENALFSVSVLPDVYKNQLSYLGKTSGRDEDKVATAGLTPIFAHGTTFFDEAKLVFICRKIYQADIIEDYFLDKSIIEKTYPLKDFHTAYLGEIVSVLAAD